MIKSKAMKLVRALRSGEYVQGKDELVDNDDKFCCLGVACNISTQPLEWENKHSDWWMDGVWSCLPKSIMKEYGFFHELGKRRDGESVNIGNIEYIDLSDANDRGCTFEEIANYIEQNYKEL